MNPKQVQRVINNTRNLIVPLASQPEELVAIQETIDTLKSSLELIHLQNRLIQKQRELIFYLNVLYRSDEKETQLAIEIEALENKISELTKLEEQHEKVN